MPSSLRFKRLVRLFAALMIAGGAAGCYVPGGGWTLRTGLDWRTHAKPGAYVELVDTRWDEWNRIAQMNAMMGEITPVVTEAAPPPTATVVPPQQPPPIPPATGVSAEVLEHPRLEARFRDEPAARRFNSSQLAGRHSIRNSLAEVQPDLSRAADPFLEDTAVEQSSWRAPTDPAVRPAGSKIVSEKRPPGGWLFRGVRR
jgi:hypothetical protein